MANEESFKASFFRVIGHIMSRNDCRVSRLHSQTTSSFAYFLCQHELEYSSDAAGLSRRTLLVVIRHDVSKFNCKEMSYWVCAATRSHIFSSTTNARALFRPSMKGLERQTLRLIPAVISISRRDMMTLAAKHLLGTTQSHQSGGHRGHRPCHAVTSIEHRTASRSL